MNIEVEKKTVVTTNVLVALTPEEACAIRNFLGAFCPGSDKMDYYNLKTEQIQKAKQAQSQLFNALCDKLEEVGLYSRSS